MADRYKQRDEELILAAQQGSYAAFDVLYERYLPMVYQRVRFKIPEQDVEDVVQEIFIAVARSLPGFRGGSQFSTWLCTLIKRQIANYYRSRRPTASELEIEMEDESGSISQAAQSQHHANTVQQDEVAALHQAIQRLPEKYADVLFMRFADGLPFGEIAIRNGQSLEATKSLFRRAVAELRKRMDETYG